MRCKHQFMQDLSGTLRISWLHPFIVFFPIDWNEKPGGRNSSHHLVPWGDLGNGDHTIEALTLTGLTYIKYLPPLMLTTTPRYTQGDLKEVIVQDHSARRWWTQNLNPSLGGCINHVLYWMDPLGWSLGCKQESGDWGTILVLPSQQKLWPLTPYTLILARFNHSGKMWGSSVFTSLTL